MLTSVAYLGKWHLRYAALERHLKRHMYRFKIKQKLNALLNLITCKIIVD